MGVLILGYPLWLLLSVLVVFALLLYFMLRGRVSEGLRLPLAVVLAPVCTVGVVAVAVVLSALLSPLYETPNDSIRPHPRISPTPEATSLETSVPTASPSPSVSATASPSTTATASPSATATASPVASPSVSATASASPSP